MKITSRFHFLTVAALVASLIAPAANATTVSPMVLDLQSSGRNVTATISVSNSSNKPLTVEIGVQALDASAAGLNPGKGSTEDLLVMPPTALIPAGTTQSFRVQWIGDPLPASSHHYYVGINQLPVKLPEGQSAVQIVYNFNVLVSVGAAKGKADLVIKAAGIGDNKGKPAPSVTVANLGSTYGYLSQHRLRLVESDKSGKVLFDKTISGNDFQQLVGYGIIATGQTRTMVLPIDLPSPAGTVTATLLDERGQ